MRSISDVCLSLPLKDWYPPEDAGIQEQATMALESGKVLLLPYMSFALTDEEQSYLNPYCVDPKTKSIKFSLSQKRAWGMAKPEKDGPILTAMLRRYAESARRFVTQLFPAYSSLTIGNTSYRPVEAEGRVQSKRHDDRLLHIDAFPSRPTHGARLLRVFTNVNPNGAVRSWRIGEPFENVAKHFLPKASGYNTFWAKAMKYMGITKTLRTPYDHFMLQLHDRMKLDDAYQASVKQTAIAFPSGSSWIVFSDQVSHAAMSGQYAFEQTFTLSPEMQANPATSPLKVLEKLTGKILT